jgi:predicted permease
MREESMSGRPAEWWEGIAHDARYVLRSLRRSPLFTATVVVTLALGIGANAALFSVLDRFFLHAPGGVREADQVRRVVWRHWDRRRGSTADATNYNYPEYHALAEAMPRGLETAAYFTDPNARLGEGGHASAAVVTYVIDDYFDVLGVGPAVGRLFRGDEHTTRVLSPVAVISWRLWHDRFALAPDIVGQTVTVGSHRYAIIGVAPEEFRGIDLDPVDVWVPRNTLGSWQDWSPTRVETPMMVNLHILVRVPPSPGAAARAEASATASLRGYVTAMDTTAQARLAPLRNAVDAGFQGAEARMSTRLTGVALLILLIACANVANLLLVRTMQRRREIATRIALGVSRGRLVAQLFTESLVLATIAGATVVASSGWLGLVLRRALLPNVHWETQALELRTCAFTALAVVLTGVAAGLIPALHASRTDLSRALRGDSGGGASHRARARSVLLVTQVSLSVVLLAAAALFVRSLRNVESVDTGYEADRVAYADVLPDMTFSPQDRETYREIGAVLPEAASRIARIPGVERTALSFMGPLQGFAYYPVFLPARDSAPTLNRMGPFTQFVSPDFFNVTGMRVLEGRSLTADDRLGAALVALVNITMARTFWPGERAVGQCVVIGKREDPCRTVIGIVSDAHYLRILEDAAMQLYVPLAQADSVVVPGAVLIRAQPERLRGVTASARDVIGTTTGKWGTPRALTMADVLAAELHPWRVGAELFSAAALLALLVAAVGVYGSIAYSVSQRTHEMGVRVAVGADVTHILGLVVGGGVRLVGIGVVVGTVIVLALGRLVASMLYGVTPHDPAVLIIVAVTFVVVAILACLIPAWRAARVDPVTLLRAE